jgi:hypothetical protein
MIFLYVSMAQAYCPSSWRMRARASQARSITSSVFPETKKVYLARAGWRTMEQK